MEDCGASPVGPSTGPRRVGAQELLTIREDQWTRQLAGASLVCELEPDPAECAEVLRALGRLYQNRRSKGYDPTDYLLRYRHALVVGMAGFAITGYQRGTFWPAFWAAVRFPGEAEDQALWGSAFIEALRRLGLPTFDDLIEQGGFRYLTRVLMHTGIPDYCLDDFFTLIAERRRIAHVTPDEFVDWAALRAATDRLTTVDVPVRRFLRYGGGYAIDLVDRVYDLLDRLADGQDESTTILPARFGAHARAWLASGHRPHRDSSRLTPSTVQRRPQLRLDPYGDGVILRLSPVDTAGESVRWQLTADGERETVSSASSWLGADLAAQATDYPLSRPVGTVSVTLGNSALEYTVPVIDRSWPVLAFDSDGRRLPTALPLPRAAVWLLYPDDGGESLVVEGVTRLVADGVLPFGWVGWRLRYLDLTEATAVRLSGLARWWSVAATAAARIEVEPPVQGCRSIGGVVHASLPRIVLPPDSTAVTWTVEISSGTDGAVLASRTVQDGQDPNLIWTHLPRPALGTFVVHVRGPLGRSARRVVTVAEGLTVTATPQRRWLTPHGLVPSELRISGGPGLSVVPDRTRLTGDQTTAQVTASAPGVTTTLMVTPPHMAVAHDRGGLTVRWRTGPLTLIAEDLLERPGNLLLTIGAAVYTRLIARAPGGVIVQDLAAKGPILGGVARFDLAELADTLRRYGQLRLATSDSDDGLCAVIQPRRLADDLTRDGDELRFDQHTPVTGLTAGVYAPLAPWWGVTPLPVLDGCVSLPARLAGAGPLRVAVRIEDPWIPAEWPSWPRAGSDVFELAGAGRPEGDGEERSLAMFLAGAADLPAAVDRPERYWRVLTLIRELVPRQRVAAAIEALGSALRVQPAAGLVALAESPLSSVEKTVALISSGLAATSGESADLVAASRAWASAPAVAALLAGRRLALPADPGDDERLLDLREAAHDRCGAALASILAGTGDPFAAAGTFGPTEDRLASFSAEQLRQLRHEVTLVPRGLLDKDTRAEAAWQLFEARSAPDLVALKRAIERFVQEIETHLAGPSRDSAAAEALRPRLAAGQVSGWRALPAFSLGAALTARAAAAGDPVSGVLAARHRSAWAALAGAAPDLVTIDLVLAEALSARAQTSTPARPRPHPPGGWQAARSPGYRSAGESQ